MTPHAFSERVAVRRRAAEGALAEAIRSLLARNSARGLLNSGATIKEAVGLGREESASLAAQLLNDYEHFKRGSAADRSLFAAAHETSVGFARTMWPFLKLDILNLQPSAKTAAESLVDEAVAAIEEIFVRHAEGLPVTGVDRREMLPRAMLGGLEGWVKANPALWALALLVGGAAIGAAITLATGLRPFPD